MLNNINKTILLLLMLAFCANPKADYNITINVNGEESYSSDDGVSDDSDVSVWDDGTISVSYNNSPSKAEKKSVSKSNDNSATASNDGIERTPKKRSLSKKSKQYARMVAEAAEKHQVDPKLLHAVIDEFHDNPDAEVITPVHQLSWKDLDLLRENARKVLKRFDSRSQHYELIEELQY